MNWQNFDKNNQDLKQNVNLGLLLQFTDEFLIPKFSEIIDEKLDARIGKLEHELKDYIDKKLAEYTSDIFKRLEKRFQYDRQFKVKILEVLKKNNLVSAEDSAFFEGLLAGQ